MGKYYVRKEASGRARWSEESLAQAMDAVRDKKMGVNEASREYGIPSRTLRRRIIKNSTKKLGLGPYGILGYENELRLVRHIKRLEESGFALTSRDLRALAFSFSKKLGLELINKVGKIIATKGAKEVFRLTSGERGETITIVACCNAERNFLPPLCIFKGVKKKNRIRGRYASWI